MLTRVLMATDGSEDAALAARAATEISKGTGSELHVVHVLPLFPRYTYPGITPQVYSYMLDKTYQEARELLDEQVKSIEDSGGRVAEDHIKRGQAVVDEILDLAEELGASLIALGSRGLGPLKRLVLGSVAEGVVYHASCPVLVARGGSDAWPPRRVVIGDDGSEMAKGAGEMAASIGRLSQAQGLLVRVFPQLPEIDVERREMNARMADDELRWEERKLEGRAREVEEVLGIRPRIRLSVGDPATVLLEIAEEDDAERTLLALGSRGLGMMRRVRLGSVSTKVLRAARGPVLISPVPKASRTGAQGFER